MSEELSVSLSLTRNLGNYNSMRVEATRTTEVKPYETDDEAFARAWAEIEAEIEKKSNEYELDN